ncbi:glycoside hydrolase family 16 protein [Natrinema versiforme]|uniref:Glycosyl hydrolase family protein n=1 Tax=Natrinema versiforme JCM 10478 TaxID=1227496 RepID=L9Y0R9_9EURY|nr:glycoside hydrolase family 16 protein [Natrinema versiforme]ELY67286.1 glycosyl hydrolase family protein [Natrinema versiforme JCM 10478]
MDPENWQVTFEDQFEGTSLNSNNWGVGFGWGNTANNDDATVTSDNVIVDNGTLRLRTTHGGGGSNDVYQGAINSKNRQYFGPGHYFEAKIKMPGRTGLLPGFWSKPNSEAWPPELDFIELFQDGNDVYSDRHHAHCNVHWSTSGQPGDGSTHTHDPLTHDTGVDLTESYNVYGCAWHEDSIDFYFNGNYIGSRDGSSMMSAVEAGAPFYMMFTTHVNRIGNADLSQAWEEEMAVDWCRVWEHAPGSGTPSDGDTTDETEEQPEEETSDDAAAGRSIEISSANGDGVRYEFTASDGGIEIDSSTGSGQEWVSDDGIYGWGTTSTSTSQVDGFTFDGKITGFGQDAPVTVRIDGEEVDPDSFGPVDPADTPWDDGSSDTEDGSETDGETDSSTDETSDPESDDSTDGTSDNESGDGTDGTSDSGSDGTTDGTEDDQSSSTPPNRITFVGTGTHGEYTFTASGRVTENPDRGTLEGDEISGSTATGTLAWYGDIDSYRFDGRLRDLSLEGNAILLINGVMVDAEEIENQL